MELFVENQTMWSVINHDPSILPVINRLGLRVGVGDDSVSIACKKHGIDVNFFLTIINVYHNENYFPEQKLMEFPVTSVVDYLRKAHKHFVNVELIEIEHLLKTLVEGEQQLVKERELYLTFFSNYKKEIIEHILDEEKTIFPYALKLFLALENISSLQNESNDLEGVVKADEHISIDNKMFDFKALIVKYLPQQYDQNTCNKLILSLFKFEKDVLKHERIEEKILFPKVLIMEQGLGICRAGK